VYYAYSSRVYYADEDNITVLIETNFQALWSAGNQLDRYKVIDWKITLKKELS